MSFVDFSKPLLSDSLPGRIWFEDSIKWYMARLHESSQLNYSAQNGLTTDYAGTPSVWRIKHGRSVPNTSRGGCKKIGNSDYGLDK
jgi:hypothetical protein